MSDNTKELMEITQLTPIDILEMIRDVFVHDYTIHKNGLSGMYITGGQHFICNCIDEISYCLNPWRAIRPDIYGTDRFEKSEHELELFKTLCRDTKSILRAHRPTSELYPEIYNHIRYSKDAEIVKAWWDDDVHGRLWTWETTLEQRIKYLNLLMEKLRVE